MVHAEGELRADATRGLTDWLIGEGRFLPDNSPLFNGFCERVAAAPACRSTGSRCTSARFTRNIAACRASGGRASRSTSGLWITASKRPRPILESPVRAVIEGREAARLAARRQRAAAVPAARRVARGGLYPLCHRAADLRRGHGQRVLLGDRSGRAGFSADEMRFFAMSCRPCRDRRAEGAAPLYRRHLLTTYVGGEAGRLILEGQVRRGDVRAITAALMLVDLRDFSPLSDQLSPRAVIAHAQRVFRLRDAADPRAWRRGRRDHGRRRAGDLPPWPRRAAPPRRAASALAAATAGLAALAERNRTSTRRADSQAGVALHYGTVSYGNIGSGNRLDFTVIGPDVNLTSRIERLCRELDRSLIMSETFRRATLHRPMWEIGHFEMRGFAKMQRLFELPPEEASLADPPCRGRTSRNNRAGAALGDAAIDFRAVMTARLVEDARAVLDPAAFRVVGAEIEPADARQRDRRGAHRARLQASHRDRSRRAAWRRAAAAPARSTSISACAVGSCVALDPVAGRRR